MAPKTQARKKSAAVKQPASQASSKAPTGNTTRVTRSSSGSASTAGTTSNSKKRAASRSVEVVLPPLSKKTKLAWAQFDAESDALESQAVASQLTEPSHNQSMPGAVGMSPSANKTTTESLKTDTAAVTTAATANDSEAVAPFGVPNASETNGESATVPPDLANTRERLSKMVRDCDAHVPDTMGYILKAINYTKPIPDGATMHELRHMLYTELEGRMLSGRDIEPDFAAFKDIDKRWWDGEYDGIVYDPVLGRPDFPKGVRKRLDDAASMLAYMGGGALSSIMRQLNPFARGLTNAEMADTIMNILEILAKDGKDIKREYMIVKSFGRGCRVDNSDPDLNFTLVDDNDDDFEFY